MDDPKFRNSKFLRFMKKLNTGGYSIENDQLVKDPEKLSAMKEKELANMEHAWNNPEEEIKTGPAGFEDIWNASGQRINQNEDMERIWEADKLDEKERRFLKANKNI